MADVEVLPELAASFKSEHGVVVQAVVPEQDNASRFQHLKATCTVCYITPFELAYMRATKKTCHHQTHAAHLAATFLKNFLINLRAIYLYTLDCVYIRNVCI